ncbi:WG repeat-containing protein [Cytophaga aurantiaca]|uniref:WG repeat-containing protein n=1 Tax=Cytophaga aurantiaca TaxID=29530 RepID=UPI00038285C0|nr:WG repeat-containing protein [Cytophaga aurantiaca]
MKYIAFFNALFLLVCIPAFSQRQYSTYQKDGYVGLEFVETHTKITLPEYEKITPCHEAKAEAGYLYIVHGHYSRYGRYVDVQTSTQFWKVVKNGKCGVINTNGKVIVPLLYDDVKYLIDTDFAVISINNKIGVIHRDGSVLIAPIYNDIMCYKNSTDGFILKASTQEHFYLINETGVTLSEFPSTLEVINIKDNRLIVTNKYSRLKGSYDLSGREILPILYDELDMNFGMYSFKQEEQAGIIDLTGKPLFSRTCNRIFPVKENRYMIDVKKGAYQLADEKGTILCTDTFSTIALHPDFMIVQSASTNKCGLLSYTGEVRIPMTFKSLSLWNGMLVAKKETTYGIITPSEKILLPFRYDHIGTSDASFILIKQKRKYGYMDKNLKMVLPCKYEYLRDIYYINNDLGNTEAARIISEKGDKTGVIDLHGNVKQPYKVSEFIGKKNEKYESGFPISLRTDYFSFEKIINPVDKMHDCIVLDKDMQEILRCYSRTPRVYDDYFLFAFTNRKYGLIAADGVIIIPFIYNQLYPFGYNHFYAQKDRYVGLLNRSGDTSIAFQYSSLGYFSDAYIIARDTNSIAKYGLIDYTGKIKMPFLYQSLYYDKRFNTNLLVANKDSLFGLIDMNENEIIPFEYTYIQQIDKTLFLVQKNGKQGLITIDNKIIIPIIYEELSSLYNNAIRVKKDGKYGILNEKNYVVIPLEYDDISSPTLSSYNYDKIFLVKKMDKIGSMDNTGKIILPIEFSSIDIYDNVSVVSKNSIYYFANGSVVNYNEPYEEITMNGNIFRTKNNGKHGIAGYNGRSILDPIYDKIDDASEGFAVEKDGQIATFSSSGKTNTPFINK